MSISSIKSEMLLPEKELIINRSFILQGRPMLIASITEQNGLLKLWIFHQLPESAHGEFIDEDYMKCVTNRDEIWKRTSYAHNNYGHISEITIQGFNLRFTSSSSPVIEHNPTSYMKLQHFMEAGVDFSSIENINLKYLILTEHVIEEGIKFPKIDTEAAMPISISMADESYEVLVEPTHWYRLEIGEHSNKEAYTFHDSIENEDISYYINRVVCYDIWKESEERFQDGDTLRTWREHGLDDAAIEQMRKSLPESLERVCPKGHVLLLIEYECQHNYQLNFYASDYLDSKPQNQNGCSSSFVMINSKEEGFHGYNLRSCLLKTVPIGFNGPVDAELISWYKRVPGYTFKD